jgi:hypothetical protein
MNRSVENALIEQRIRIPLGMLLYFLGSGIKRDVFF